MAMGNNPNISDKAKIQEVAVQFESIMVKELLDQALAPLLKNSMKNVPGSNVYQGIIIDNLADTLSRSNQMGVAQVFERELTRFASQTKPELAEELETPKPEEVSETAPTVDLKGNPLPQADELAQDQAVGSPLDLARKQAISQQSL